MIKFVAHLKTIAAAPLALAAVLFSSTAWADVDLIYISAPIADVSVKVSSGSVSTNLIMSYTSGTLLTSATTAFSPFANYSKTLRFEVTIPEGYDYHGLCKLNKSLTQQPTSAEDFNLTSPVSTNLTWEADNLGYKIGHFNAGTLNNGSTYIWGYPLYVDITPQEYSLSFISNGGSSCSSVRIVYDQTYAGKLPSTARTGYTFLGWYTGPDGGTRISETTVVKVTEDQTLYAQWQAISASVTLNPQLGTVSPACVNLTYDSTYELPTPIREGYSFDGWYTAESGGTKIDLIGQSKFTADLELFAHWSIIRSTLTVNTSGEGSGSVSPGGTRTYDYGLEVDLSATPNRGSEFVRWSDGNTDASRTITVTTNATYTATFALKQFTVTFDAGSGSCPTDGKTVTYSKSYGELPVPTWTGHTFVEWRTPGGSRITADTIVYLEDDTKLSAYYTTNSFLVQVLSDSASEGSGSVSSGGRYEYGTTLTIQASPSDGSRFVCWNDGDVNPSRTITVTQDVNYVATFALCEYSVSFVYYNSAGELVTQTQQVKYRKSATPPSKDVVDCYPKHHFLGWGNTSYGTITGDLQIQAMYDWNTYNIRYNSNASGGVSGYMGVQALKVDVQYALSPNKYSRIGYTFLGWSRDSAAVKPDYLDQQTVDALTTVHDETVDLYAIWKANTYTVTFDPNGTSATVDPQTKAIDFDSPYGELPVPTRANYSFEGWFTAANGGVEVSEETTLTMDRDHTLYAHWSAKYTIHFDKDGGSGEMPDQVAICGERFTLNPNTLSKTGYIFYRWELNGSKRYQDGATITSDLAAPGEEVTLKAIWSPIEYVIAFDANWTGRLGVLTDPPPANTRCAYDEEVKLSWSPDTKGLYSFIGWSTNQTATVAEYKPDVWYSRLSSVQDDVVTLYAVWQDNLSDYSKAVGCDNVQLSTGKLTFGKDWVVLESGGICSGGFLETALAGVDESYLLKGSYPGKGTLVFDWALTNSSAKAYFNGQVLDPSTHRYIKEFPGPTAAFEWKERKGDSNEGSFIITSIRWYPNLTKEEVEALLSGPEPTEADRPVITTDFTFATKPDFDYVIWEATTLENGGDWVARDPIEGDGTAITLPMFEDPQGFFKVQVIQRGSR